MIRKLFMYYWDVKQKTIEKLEATNGAGSFQKAHESWLKATDLARKRLNKIRKKATQQEE